MEEELIVNQRIQALYEYGIKAESIYNHLVKIKIEISRAPIYNKIAKQQKGQSFAKKEYHRENEKVTNEIEEEIVEYFEEADQNANFPNLLNFVKEELNLPISTMRLSQVLKDHEIVYQNVVQKPLISDVNIQKRLQFTNYFIDFDWDNALFADETTFLTHTYYKSVQAFKDSKVEQKQTQISYQSQCMGCNFKNEKKTRIHLLSNNLDSQYYCNILETVFLLNAKILFCKEKWILVQDNDPKHTSKAYKNFYAKNHINVFDSWPSSSPDLNPIENIWVWVKHELKILNVKTVEELQNQIIIVWDKVPQEFIDNAIDSLPDRLEQVINTGGIRGKCLIGNANGFLKKCRNPKFLQSEFLLDNLAPKQIFNQFFLKITLSAKQIMINKRTKYQRMEIEKPMKPSQFKLYNTKWESEYKWITCEYIYDEQSQSWKDLYFVHFAKIIINIQCNNIKINKLILQKQ